MLLRDVVGHLSIDPSKVTRFLLAMDHPRGGSKARFLMRFGFRPESPRQLLDALLTHCENAITTVESFTEATVYTIEGQLESPDGRNPHVRTVWQVDAGANDARFITAVPLSRGRTAR